MEMFRLLASLNLTDFWLERLVELILVVVVALGALKLVNRAYTNYRQVFSNLLKIPAIIQGKEPLNNLIRPYALEALAIRMKPALFRVLFLNRIPVKDS